MNKKKPKQKAKPPVKKVADATKKASPAMGKRISQSTIEATIKVDRASNLVMVITGKRKSAARFVRVVMNPVVKPKHFSVSAIRNAVQQVVASR